MAGYLNMKGESFNSILPRGEKKTWGWSATVSLDKDGN